MTWWNRVEKEARKRLEEEPRLLRESYSPDFATHVKETNLFFSFGDVAHLIRIGIRVGLSLKQHGAGLMLAHYETLIKRFKLYLIRQLKTVLDNKEPYRRTVQPYREQIDYNFVSDFLDLFKELDRAERELKIIREKEASP